MQFTAEQTEVLKATGNTLVLGAPGTGRTTVLVEKAARLIEAGAPDGSVAIVTFSWRSQQYITSLLEERMGKRYDAIKCATMRDYSTNALEDGTGKKPKIADFLTVRRLLREAMNEASFSGTVAEAEHAVRGLKSFAQRPNEEMPNFALLQAYQTLLDAHGMTDRHDVIRKHIIAINAGKAKPIHARYILIDNLQDATQIQLVWLLEHMKGGALITAFGNDDECVFGRDGARGSGAFKDLRKAYEFNELTLTKDFALTADIGKAADVIVEKLPERIQKTVEHLRDGLTPLKIEQLESAGAEIELIVSKLPEILETGERVAIITASDSHALHIERALQRASLVHSSFAQGLWRTPPALMVMDLLHVLLNQASNSQLRNVLIGNGFRKGVVDTLFNHGMLAQDWILAPEKIPSGAELPSGAVAEYGAFCRRMKGYFKAMAEFKLSPREVFKAAALDIIEKMHNDEKLEALLVLDAMVHMPGKLVEFLPKLRQRRSPKSSAQLVVTTVQEARNMGFDHVFMPFVSSEFWPNHTNKVLGVDEENDRRRFYFAVTRARKSLTLTYSGEQSPFAVELYNSWRDFRRGARG